MSRFSEVVKRGKVADEPAPEPEVPQPTSPAPATLKIGRPPGKKSNPLYTQVTVYLRKDVHLRAKKALIDEDREFSELVDELVHSWLENSRHP